MNETRVLSELDSIILRQRDEALEKLDRYASALQEIVDWGNGLVDPYASYSESFHGCVDIAREALGGKNEDI